MTLLFQALLSPTYWVEALHTAVHLLNILPSSSIQNKVPYTLLYHKEPSYSHLKTIGCLCFPNLNHSYLHKLAARSTPCLFLGYPTNHKGYRCLERNMLFIVLLMLTLCDPCGSISINMMQMEMFDVTNLAL